MEYLLHVMCVVHPVHPVQPDRTHNLLSPITAWRAGRAVSISTAFVYHNRLQGNNLEGRRIFPQKEYARQSEHFYDYVT